MEIEIVTIVLFGELLLLLALGVYVAFALGAISVVVAVWLDGFMGLFNVAMTTYSQLTSAALIPIPLFVLMSSLLLQSGMSDRLYQALGYWFSGLKGGLAIVSLFVCVLLAMTGGFAPGTLTMGTIAVPAMLSRGYNKQLALGSVMAGGVLGIIIPSSVLMIVFGYITKISVGKLFFGGVLPGFLCAGLFFMYIFIRCSIQPELAPISEEKITWKMRLVSLKEVILPILIIASVLFSIFFGIATPSEAAALGALGAFIVCVLNGKMNRDVLNKASLSTFKIIGMVMWILVSATLFSVVYTSAGAQSLVMELISGLEVNRWLIIFGMQLLLLLFGMFMDDFAVVTICAPIFLPIVTALGFDPLWFAIVFILNMQLAYMSPPFGWSLILMKGITDDSCYHEGFMVFHSTIFNSSVYNSAPGNGISADCTIFT